jgi:hypothetical protein
MQDPQRSNTQDFQRVADAVVVDEDEVVLGWECANPALQIERWLQETPPSLPLEPC